MEEDEENFFTSGSSRSTKLGKMFSETEQPMEVLRYTPKPDPSTVRPSPPQKQVFGAPAQVFLL
jgi:hypothetical protein